MSHPWIRDSSVNNYHSRNRACDSNISITRQMDGGMRGGSWNANGQVSLPSTSCPLCGDHTARQGKCFESNHAGLTHTAVVLPTLAKILVQYSIIHSPPALFFSKVEISSRTLIPLFMPGSVHNGSASWDDCGWMFHDKLRVSSFPGRFPHHAWTAAKSAHSDFVGSRVYACYGETCHLQFWQNEGGLWRASAASRDGTDTE